MAPATGAVGRVAKEVLGLVCCLLQAGETGSACSCAAQWLQIQSRTVYLKTLEVEKIVDL